MGAARVECPGCGYLYKKLPWMCKNCGVEIVVRSWRSAADRAGDAPPA